VRVLLLLLLLLPLTLSRHTQQTNSGEQAAISSHTG
jgi:hypothetical protein